MEDYTFYDQTFIGTFYLFWPNILWASTRVIQVIQIDLFISESMLESQAHYLTTASFFLFANLRLLFIPWLHVTESGAYHNALCEVGY